MRDPEIAAAVHAQSRSLAHERFEHADLFKPRDGDATGLKHELAPLILEETRAGSATSQPAGDRHLKVFVSEATATLGGRVYRQIAYHWAYWECRKGPFGMIRCSKTWRGVRLTLDDHGYPLVYEANDLHPNRLFVSKSFEQAAAAEYGALPGRISSAERSMEEEPMTVVVRVLEDGPVPMGPIIYLAGPDRVITNIICRCMPSQVRNIVRTEYYRLIVPAESQAAQIGPVFDCPEGIDDPSRLERILRWPHGL